MNQETRVQLIASLTNVIDDWFGEESDKSNKIYPYVGDETFYLMAESAVNILCANSDIENYFKREGLPEDK